MLVLRYLIRELPWCARVRAEQRFLIGGFGSYWRPFCSPSLSDRAASRQNARPTGRIHASCRWVQGVLAPGADIGSMRAECESSC